MLLAAAVARGERKPAPTNNSGPVTVPMTVDHNQTVIDVIIPRSDGSPMQVKALIGTASPELWTSRRVAEALGATIICDAQVCAGTLKSPDPAIYLGEMKIPLPTTSKIKIPAADDKIVPGTTIEISLPSTLLRNYDVLVDFPEHRVTLGQPATIHFEGASARVQINPSDGAIRVPSKIENKKYNLVLDLAAPISRLSDDLFEKLSAEHPAWPRMIGAVGPANMGAADVETQLKIMRVDRVQFGSLFLIDLPVEEASESQPANVKSAAGPQIAGLLGADVLQNYRVGIDYAHSMLYLDIGRMSQFPEFDVVGLTLRPENGGGFIVIGIVEFEGKPSVADVQIGDRLIAVDGIPVANSTMGQVWSMLGGTPGQERKLTIERSGKEVVVVATVRHFLAAGPDQDDKKHKRTEY